MRPEIIFRRGQDKVMEYEGGYMAVPSVPGAGKTFVLTQLAAKLIEEERHRPGKILIVTYMNSAVANFKDRIYTLLKEGDLNPMEGYEVMTLHTLAMKIIRERPDKLLLDDEFTILDDTKQAELFRDIFESWRIQNREAFYSLVDDRRYSHQRLIQMEENWARDFYQIAPRSFDYFKIQGYDAKTLEALLGGSEEDSMLRWVSKLYLEYETRLRQRGLIDFNDILVGALRLLKDDSHLLESYQNRYSFIFEDEAQDSNIIQQEMLMMLSENTGNLIRVGDSNQAIMSTFTVSDPRLFRDFCDNPLTQNQSINVASRSCSHVIDLANFFVSWTRTYHPCQECRESLADQYIEEVDSDDPFPNPVISQNSVYFKDFKSFKDEIDYVVRRCQGHIEKKPEKTLAVLVPTNWMAGQLVEEFEKRQIPYRELTRFPRERAYAATVIGAVLQFIVYPYEEENLSSVVRYILEDEGDGELEEISSLLKEIPPEELLYPLYGSVDRWEIPSRLEEILPLLREFLELSSEMPEFLVLHIAERLEFDWDRMAIAQKIASDIRYLVSLNPDWSLTHLAQELSSIDNPYNYFANIVYDMQGFDPDPGEVTIATLHKAKGLEWDTVFLPAMTSYNFPARLEDKFRGECYYLREDYQNPEVLIHAQFDELIGRGGAHDAIAQSKIDIINERIRLLYVGFTRAKEYLILTSNGDHSIYYNVCRQYLLREKRGPGVDK